MNERNFSTEKEEQLRDRVRNMVQKYYTPKGRLAIEIGISRDKAYYTLTRWLHGTQKLTDKQLDSLDRLLTDKGC